MSDSTGNPSTDLHAFAATVAHEIRTPLAAISGEIEIALRRDRSAIEYREALRRIAAGVSELLELSGDLTLLGHPVAQAGGGARNGRLEAILHRVQQRYMGRRDVTINVDLPKTLQIAGDEERLARAITLVIEHAIRHRRNDAPISIRAVGTSAHHVRLVVEAHSPGFWPSAWSSLTEVPGHAGDPLRLRTARGILDAHGGQLTVACASGTDAVHIELPRSI